LEELLRLNIFAYFMVFARVGTATMFLPGLSATYVSPRVRLAFALTMSLVVLPPLAADLPVMPASVSEVAVLLTGEVLVGAFFGFMMRILISCLQTAGTIAALSSSMANAMIQDPIAESQSSTISGFLLTMGVVLIFVSDLHHMMLRGIIETYAMFRPGDMLPVGDIADVVARQVADSFTVGLKLSAPFVVVGLTYYIGLGLLSRLMPQLPVFFFGLPLQITVQISVFTITLSGIMLAFIQYFQSSAQRFVP
ncbi:MAG: flagellar biosynthetic protein FliR, partial [Rhodospirillaceae bacterium]